MVTEYKAAKRMLKKHKMLVYESEKARIQRRNLSPDQYEKAITELAKRLGI